MIEVPGTNTTARDLTLMLIYLTSWTEGVPNWLNEPPVRRCWKGFRFEILDELEARGLITNVKRNKSLYLTSEGEEEARSLLARHGFERNGD